MGQGLEAADLVGRRIVSAHKDIDTLYFAMDRGVFALRPEGDCCASAYFAHVDGSAALVDAVVLGVEDLEQSWANKGGEQIDTWGHRIITTRGTCTLDMRTEHNGYYSGWLNSPTLIDALPVDANPLRDF